MKGNVFEHKVEHIVILAMGPTWYQCPRRDLLPPSPECEVWGINTMYLNYAGLDRLFMMHDIRTEIMLNDKAFVKNVNEEKFPIYTAGNYDCLKNNIPYPMEEVIDYYQVAYFLNSLSYAIALAIMQKPMHISFFGIDMRPDSEYEWHNNEKGCVEFWCGVAVASRILLHIPKESYVMRRAMTGAFYGFFPRKSPDGLVHMVPNNDRRKYGRYKLIPVDNDGNELEDPVIITPKTLIGNQEDNASLEGARLRDVKI